MADTVTRISELPENITMQMPQQYAVQQSAPQFQLQGNVGAQQMPQQQLQNQMMQGGDMGQNTYVPINIHPNPYGPQGPPGAGLPPPQGSPQRGGQGPGPGQGPIPQYQSDPLAGMPQQRLPSRDIPMNQLEFQQDEEIQPNYVPKVKLTSDYIREYEAASEHALKKHESGKHREKLAGNLFSDLQLPILVALLYFIYQMPIVTTLLRKHFAFLKMYHDDGNINFTGLVLKSLLFGSTFYSVQYIAHAVSNM